MEDIIDTYTDESLEFWEENDMMDPEEAAFVRGFNDKEAAQV